jgi:hypothetical protein
MKPGLGILVFAVVVAWLGLWVTDTGVLVYSDSTGVLSTRDCRYLIGVTVVKRLEPLAQRCRVIAKVGK